MNQEDRKMITRVKTGRPPRTYVKDNEDRKDIKRKARTTEIGKAIVDTHPDISLEDFDHEKYNMVKRLFLEWLNSRTTGEVISLLEIKNLLKILKMDFAKRLSHKVANHEELDELDHKRIQQLLESYVDLHKLQHGEKKVVTKMDFKFVRDLT